MCLWLRSIYMLTITRKVETSLRRGGDIESSLVIRMHKQDIKSTTWIVEKFTHHEL